MTVTRNVRFWVGAAACVAIVLMVWEWASATQLSVVMPGPDDTIAALWSIILDGTLVTELALTLGRAALATFIAFAAGVVLGWLASESVLLDGFLAPLRAMLQGLPPIVLIVVLVLWMGSDPAITIIVTSAVMTPIVAAAASGALRGIDPHLRELSKALQLGRTRNWALIVIPAALPPVVAATGAVASGAVRVTVMAELLSAPDGVGAAIAQNRTLLQTPELFAWTVSIVVCALLVDIAIRVAVNRWSHVFTPGDQVVSPHSPADTRNR